MNIQKVTKHERDVERKASAKDYPILDETKNTFFHGNRQFLLFEYLRNISLQLEEVINLLQKK